MPVDVSSEASRPSSTDGGLSLLSSFSSSLGVAGSGSRSGSGFTSDSGSGSGFASDSGSGSSASPPAEGETRERREALLRAAVRAGLDPMFPVIDYEPSEGEGLSGDEEDADIIERYDVTVPSEDADASPGEARR